MRLISFDRGALGDASFEPESSTPEEFGAYPRAKIDK